MGLSESIKSAFRAVASGSGSSNWKKYAFMRGRRFEDLSKVAKQGMLPQGTFELAIEILELSPRPF